MSSTGDTLGRIWVVIGVYRAWSESAKQGFAIYFSFFYLHLRCCVFFFFFLGMLRITSA